MVFADIGVNPTAWGYSPCDDIIKKLIARGICAAEQIAAIGEEADSDAKKQALFEKVWCTVRVLIGSTQKMGTGTNVQKRLAALHHLDAPWKPAEVEQREGRILRQGNQNEEVAIYRYVTEGSFDAYMWQALETKARFINQVITGDNALRQADDIGSQELSYAEVKAIASGNPAVPTLAEADAELQRPTLLEKNHLDEQYVARRAACVGFAGDDCRPFPASIELYGGQSHCHGPCQRPDHLRQTPHRPRGYDQPSSGWATRHLAHEYPREDLARRLGTYRGLRFGMVLNPQWSPEVYLEGATMRLDTLSRDHHGPRAVLNALERLANAYGSECARVKQDLAIAESQLRDYQARLGKPFLHDAYLSELTSLRDRLKAGLSATACSGDDATGGVFPSSAARIKALKAANTIETTPQRAQRKQAAAEEPVTTRIRRRLRKNRHPDQAIESHDAAEAQPASIQNSPGTPPMMPSGTGVMRSLEGRQNGEGCASVM